MSTSTNAEIFYGYCWSEEQDSLFAEDGDVREGEWSEAILRRRGLRSPWDDYPPENESLSYDQRRKAGDEWCTANRERLDEWRTAKAAVEAEFGVEVGAHCSGDYPMPLVRIAKAGTTARRGYPEPITTTTLTTDPGWAAKLDRFLAEFGIEKPQDHPNWWLVSYWG